MQSTASSQPGGRASDAGGGGRPLSCAACRARKVKCSRTYPCPQCVRAGMECVFPARKRTRRPRQDSRQGELLNRLAKLEEIVGRVDPSALGAPGPSPGVAGQPPAPAPQAAGGPRPEDRGVGSVSSPPREDVAGGFLSAEFWANLSSEVQGIRQALDQPSDGDGGDDDDDDGQPRDESSPESVYQVSPAVLGEYTCSDKARILCHPPADDIRQLRDIYFENVDPILKILHRPSMLRVFDALIATGHAPDRATEALVFAMYFAAVTSVSAETCRQRLGKDRGDLVAAYKLATEAALARAGYLNSVQLESLQAFTLYVAVLRNHNESRASWALLALALRLSQAYGLQRDGDGAAFPPFEAEMRRRLWWQVVVLDVRAAQDRGAEAMINTEMYNTRLPTDVDDDDFGPGRDPAEALAARGGRGGTDATYAVCAAACSALFLYLISPQSKFRKPDGAGAAAPPAGPPGEDVMLREIRGLEARFVHGANMAHYPSALASRTARLVVLVFWLETLYPFQVRQGPAGGRGVVPRELTLQTAVSVLELHHHIGAQDHPYAERSRWWVETLFQWHPLAVALAELCAQTQGPLVDKAWRVIDDYLPRWAHKVADSKRGSLWRPIKRLLRKARMARAEAQMGRVSLGAGGGGGGGGGGAGGGRRGADTAAAAAAAAAASGTAAGQQDTPTVASGAGEPAAAWEEPAPLLDATFDDLGAMSPSSYLFQDGGFTFTQELTAGQDMTMDWSNWNEFVTDAYDAIAESGESPEYGV